MLVIDLSKNKHECYQKNKIFCYEELIVHSLVKLVVFSMGFFTKISMNSESTMPLRIQPFTLCSQGHNKCYCIGLSGIHAISKYYIGTQPNYSSVKGLDLYYWI